MRIDIGLIITENYLPYLKSIEKELEEPCNFHYYLLNDISDLKTIYQDNYYNVDAFVFSGLYIYELLEEEISVIDEACFIISDSMENIYKELLTIFLKHPGLNPSRVYIDFITDDMNKVKDLFPQNKMPYFLALDFNKPCSLAKEVLNNHEKLWNEGKIDLSITKFETILDELDRKEIKYEYISPSYKNMKNFLNEILNKIRFEKLNRNKVAVIFVEFFNKKLSLEKNYELEIKNLKLLGEIEDFAKDNNFDFLMNRNSSGVEILTTIEDVLKLTDGLNHPGFQSYLEEKLGESISIGYGTGKNFSQANENASKALIHSKEYHKGLSVVVCANQKTLTLSGEDAIIYTQEPSPKIIDLSNKLDISDIYLQKIVGYCEKMNKNKVYSKEISKLLGVTERTANRTLNRIAENNGATISVEQKDNLKGRPTKFYILNFIDESGQLRH